MLILGLRALVGKGFALGLTSVSRRLDEAVAENNEYREDIYYKDIIIKESWKKSCG